MSVHRALHGSWVYMWPNLWTMVPVKPQQTLHGSNTTGLGSTQTTLLEYHMQEWIGHLHYMQGAVSWENGPG